MVPNLGPARRRMDLMASVSRSSGLEKDGDDLKNHKTQEEYRDFIQEKLDAVLKNHPWTVNETEDAKKQRLYEQENVLILFRKLREGVASAARTDDFALEVYETSFFLSIIFESPKQTTAIIQHLIPSPPSTTTPFKNASIFVPLCSLLHHLVASYPSQGTYHQHLDTIPESLLPRKSEHASWVFDIAKSLRRRNYAKFAYLSKKETLVSVLGSEQQEPATDVPATTKPLAKFGKQALFVLLNLLRQKAASTAWTILRASYRELACNPGNDDTRTWLVNSMCLDSVLSFVPSTDLDKWLHEQESSGHLRAKEGADGRWIVCKVR
ncbi:hypothetical protein CVT24_007004 [Panaeolus cyanescens]|uniref:CSN8/PSMD8/EIF3K domain-containing protein n=1 Tax=Panaeolus cyanescens TaxID=181874 RepID=A0A409YKF5_9AGAR|nr:hypothetical protein CVT24_007004 [Panaeolus cyanescens]